MVAGHLCEGDFNNIKHSVISSTLTVLGSEVHDIKQPGRKSTPDEQGRYSLVRLEGVSI